MCCNVLNAIWDWQISRLIHWNTRNNLNLTIFFFDSRNNLNLTIFFFDLLFFLIWTKSNSNDDSQGIDDSNKNPGVENKKPMCLTFFIDTCLDGRFEYTINDTQSNQWFNSYKSRHKDPLNIDKRLRSLESLI